MGLEEDFALPPRYTRPVPSSVSRSSSVASSTDARSHKRSSRPPPSHAPSGSQYLQTRVLSIADYADELQHGGPELLEEHERIQLFGSIIVPIPIPLEPREKEATHEKRFRGWLAKRRVNLENETVASERKLRIDFAKMKTRRYDNGSLFQDAARSGKRSRETYEEDEEEQENEHEHDDDDEEQEDEEFEDPTDRTVEVKRPRVEAPVNQADNLLRQRVLSIEQYRLELEHEKTRKLTPAERKELYGSTTVPVPIPLFPGETVDAYERAFLAYVSEDGTYPARFVNAPNAERSARMTFARIRAKQEDVVVKAPPATSILDRVGQVKAEDVKGHTENGGCHRSCFPATCSLVRPYTGSSTTSLLRAFLSCGCRECVMQCTHRLVDHLERHEEKEREAKARPVETNSSTQPKPVEPAAPPRKVQAASQSSTNNGVDIAKMVQLTSLMKSRRIRQSTATTTSRLSDSSTSRDDPIELQLQSQYDEINARVGENQRTLASVTAQLHATPVDRVDLAESLQSEKQDFETLLEEEMDHRNAALAMLAVYLWRNDKAELTLRIQNPSASNVEHVQRVCHEKCATIANDVTQKQAHVATLKQELDAVLMAEAALDDDRRFATLQRVGEELTRAEETIKALYAARRREIATLLHFDAHVRELVETLLMET